MIQLAGSPKRIQSFIELLRPFGIVEIHRSGVIAMGRGDTVDIDQTTFQGATRTIMDEPQVDAENLPPG